MILAITIVAAFCIQWSGYVLLKRFKTQQQIYDLAPESHQKKTSTVSMGGIGIMLSVLTGWCVFQEWSWQSAWLIGLTFGYAIVGCVDDS